MKLFAQRTLVALIICAFATVGALAGSKDTVKKEVTFASDTTVNGTLVKAGTYQLNYDAQTGAIEVKKGGKVVATATARAEQRDKKASDTVLRTISKDNGVELIGITFGGSDQNLVIGASGQVNGN